MATQTSAEVRNMALREMGLLRMGETADAAQSEDLDDAYNEVYEQLQEMGLTGAWSSAAAVPNPYVPHVKMMMAHSRANTWRVANERFQGIVLKTGVDDEKSIAAIRRIVTGKNISDVTTFSDF